MGVVKRPWTGLWQVIVQLWANTPTMSLGLSSDKWGWINDF